MSENKATAHGPVSNDTNERDKKIDKKREEVIQDLFESYRKIGPLHPVLITEFGLAAGQTRLDMVKKMREMGLNVPDWPVKHVDVHGNYFDHLSLKLGDNIREIKDDKWWSAAVLETWIYLTGKEGNQKGMPPVEAWGSNSKETAYRPKQAA